MRWPLVLRSTYDRLVVESDSIGVENRLLKTVLHEANKEIRKLRSTVVELAGKLKEKTP